MPITVVHFNITAYSLLHNEPLDIMRVSLPRQVLKVTVGAKKIGVRYLTAAFLFTTTPRPILGHRHPPNRREMATVCSIGIEFSGGKKLSVWYRAQTDSHGLQFNKYRNSFFPGAKKWELGAPFSTKVTDSQLQISTSLYVYIGR